MDGLSICDGCRVVALGVRHYIGPVILAIILIQEGHTSSRVTLGGYVPFASSMQEDRDGKLNIFSFAPILGVGASVPLEELTHHFSPELGVVFHKSGAGDDYTKSTFYVLGDLEMKWGSFWRFRYGLGFFATLIDGRGGTVWRENGDQLEEVSRPSKKVISYSMSLDFGWDYRISQRWFLRMETFLFSIWDSQARDMSYLLVLGHNFF